MTTRGWRGDRRYLGDRRGSSRRGRLCRHAELIAAAEICRMSIINYVEAGVVVDSQLGTAAGRELDTLIDRAGIVLEPVTVEHGLPARQSYVNFGRGPHAARLNLGDCSAYALAKATGEPLLFKGNDFSGTDISIAS
ncbi:MAG: type II toxin-antitoxin system VapC family toxin [Rhodospirillales bacterium]